jgi:hypothetical protein
MATVLTQTYSANTAITLDLSSLGASSTFVAGRESTQIDNTSTMYVDAIVNVLGITGSASAATAGQGINVYVWGADTSLATTAIDALDGTDSAETITLPTLQSLRLAGRAYTTVTTASQVYYIMPFSVAALFGGGMPKFWGLFVATDLTGGLAAAMSGKFSFNGITYTNT